MEKLIGTLITLALLTCVQAQVITNQPSNRAAWLGGNVTFIVGVSNAEPLTYQWQFDGSNLSVGGIIMTVAGNGSYGYSGDGGEATNASMRSLSGVAVDGFDNLFIADSGNNRIRRVDTNGIITTVAGGGPTMSYPDVGDGGPATNATLNSPQGVVADAFGNLFIADSQDGLIRRVDTNGIIMTVAGGGVDFPYNGDLATNVLIIGPFGVAVDEFGNLFFTDSGRGLVCRVDPNGIITTVAGGGSPVSPSIGDGGPATNALLAAPWGISVDGSGNLFIADSGNNRIRRVDTNGIITTVAGPGFNNPGVGGLATNAFLNGPDGVAVDEFGNLFIADSGNSAIDGVDTNGIFSIVAGEQSYGYSGDGGPATNAMLGFPTGVALDKFGNLFIADEGKGVVREVTSANTPMLTLTSVGLNNAGNYDVVVTGFGGSVTSSVVNLTVTTSPLVYKAVRNRNGSFALNFVSRPYSTNLVLFATSLSPPVVWQLVSTNVAGANGDWQFIDTNTVGCQVRFYRSWMQ